MRKTMVLLLLLSLLTPLAVMAAPPPDAAVKAPAAIGPLFAGRYPMAACPLR